jgi:hypothetical protein
MTKTAPTIFSVISTLPVIAACALLGATQARAETDPPYVVFIQQVGPNVVVTGSGDLDLTGLSGPTSTTVTALVFPAHAGVGLANGPANQFSIMNSLTEPNNFTGPSTFGTGLENDAGPNNNDGPPVGLEVFPSGSGSLLVLQVPTTYTSGAPLSASQITFDNATLASLGITPDETFTWRWGPAADQSFTIDTTPLPAALPLFASGLGALGLLGWRRKRRARGVA